jgi:serine/threonine protein kinase
VFLVRVTGEKEFVKVLDFGISKVRGGGPRLTAQNMVIGTPAYMAPEQARGERDVDHRVDQFALAAITYEMLAGQSPFPGEDPVEIMRGVIAANPTPLATVAPWISVAVQSVVARGMQKQAADRFPNISDYSTALEQAVSGAESGTSVPATERRTAAAPLEQMGTYSEKPPAERVERVPTSAARNEKPTPVAVKVAPLERKPSGAYGSASSPLSAAARTPPKADAAHLIEHFSPVSRRGSSPPSRTPISQPASPMPDPIKETTYSVNVPPSVPPYERISHAPSNPPPSAPPASRQGASTPDGSSDKNVLRAQQMLEEARAALRLGRLDDAVAHAEQLLELAVFGKNNALYQVLRSGMPVVDHIFEARVGPLDRRLEITAQARDPKKLNLSVKAAFVLACAEGGVTLQEVIDSSGIPRRDVIRMLAGLMRRGALVPH